MGSDSISWNSKCQAFISQSSCEFKYYALSETEKDGLWLRLLLQELSHITAALTVIWADNQGVIVLAKNTEFYKCTKHIDTKFYWVWEVIESNILLCNDVPHG